MSMFEKRREPETELQRETTNESRPAPQLKPASRGIASIGETITIKGDVTGEETLIIEGKVDGTVSLGEHDLTVGQGGLVTASVNAGLVKIEGKVTGDIKGTDKVVLTRTGRVEGDIVAPRVTLEDGAKFKGRIDMDPASNQPAKAPEAPQAMPALRTVDPTDDVAEA